MKTLTNALQQIRKFFFPLYFKRFSNGKFFAIERYFMFWVISTFIASLRMAYEGKMDINSFNASDILYLPLILGAAYHFWLKIAPSLSVLEIDEKHWRSKLVFLWQKNQRGMVEKELRELRELEAFWELTYKEPFSKSKLVKLNGYLPWLWIAFILISIWVFI